MIAGQRRTVELLGQQIALPSSILSSSCIRRRVFTVEPSGCVVGVHDHFSVYYVGSLCGQICRVSWFDFFVAVCFWSRSQLVVGLLQSWACGFVSWREDVGDFDDMICKSNSAEAQQSCYGSQQTADTSSWYHMFVLPFVCIRDNLSHL